MSLSRYLLSIVVQPVLLAIVVFFSLLFSLPKAYASEGLDKNLQTVEQAHRAGAKTQRQVDDLSVDSRLLYSEYQQVLRHAETTEAYNRQLSRLIFSQETELGSLDGQIQSLENTDRSLLPMLVRMVDRLNQFVGQDQPFLLDERQKRVSRLQGLLDRADVSLAEKYRQILQAYQIEVDYGRSLEAYEGEVTTLDGKRQVTFLRLGRVALYYQSANGQAGGLWQPQSQSWLTLTAEDNRVLKNAIQMARQQVVPELLDLPLPMPESSSSLEADA